MVFCKDCVYICPPSGYTYKPHPDSICEATTQTYMNYVTGVPQHMKCKERNKDGECLWFKLNR